MPDSLRTGLLGPLQLADGAGRAAHADGRQLRVLLILLALAAGRVVPSSRLAALARGDGHCSARYARLSRAGGSFRT